MDNDSQSQHSLRMEGKTSSDTNTQPNTLDVNDFSKTPPEQSNMPKRSIFIRKFFLFFIIVFIIFGVGYGGYKNIVPVAYPSKQACENESGKRCDLQICNDPPCGWRFREGWVQQSDIRIAELEPSIAPIKPRNDFISIEYSIKTATSTSSLLLSQNGVFSGWIGDPQFGIPIEGSFTPEEKEQFRTLLNSQDYASLPPITSSAFSQAVCLNESQLSIRTERGLTTFSKKCDCFPKESCSFFAQVEEKIIRKFATALNISSCEKAGSIHKAQCYSTIGIQNSDATVCEAIADMPHEEFERNRCYMGVATSIQNILLCEQIATDDTDATLLLRQTCYETSHDFSDYMIPANLSAPALIEMCINGPISHVDQCLLSWAVDTKSASICSEIKSVLAHDDCFTSIAKFLKDSEFCENITGDTNKWRCLTQVAIEAKNITFCMKIATSTREGKILFDTCERQVTSNYPL